MSKVLAIGQIVLGTSFLVLAFYQGLALGGGVENWEPFLRGILGGLIPPGAAMLGMGLFFSANQLLGTESDDEEDDDEDHEDED